MMLTVNIPKRGRILTNGDVIKAVFPHIRAFENDTMDDMYGGLVDVYGMGVDDEDVTIFTLEWWNAPYKGSEQHDG